MLLPSIIFIAVLILLFLFLLPKIRSSFEGNNKKRYKYSPLLIILAVLTPFFVKYFKEKFNFYERSGKLLYIEEQVYVIDSLARTLDSIADFSEDTTLIAETEQKILYKKEKLSESLKKLDNINVSANEKFFYPENAALENNIKQVQSKIEELVIVPHPASKIEVIYYQKNLKDTLIPKILLNSGFNVIARYSERNKNKQINALFYGADVEKEMFLHVASVLLENNIQLQDIQYFPHLKKNRSKHDKANIIEIGTASSAMDKRALTISEIEKKYLENIGEN